MQLSFLLSVVDLFDGIFKAIMGVPVLGFLMTSLLFFCVVSLFFWLVSWGKNRKM